MRRSIRRGVAGSSAISAVLALNACGGGGGGTSSSTASPSNSPTSSSGGGGGSAATLTAQNIRFEPTSLSVAASAQATITLVNKDSVEHSLTFDDNSHSVDADGGETKTLSFTAPAAGTTISFHCKYHPTQMRGTITVTGR